MSTPSMNANELLGDFAEEATSELRSLPEKLEEYYRAPSNIEPINAVFRAVHSIKGNASFFGLVAIKSFAHAVEGSLDALRTNRFPLSAELKRDLVAATDALDEMIGAALEGVVEQCLPLPLERLLGSIAKHVGAASATDPRTEEIGRLLRALRRVKLSEENTPLAWLEGVISGGIPQVLKQLDANGNADDEKPAPQVAGQPPTAAQLATTDWSAKLELADKLPDILELFLAFERGGLTESHRESFLASAEELERWARKANQPDLSVAAGSAANSFRAMCESGIELDSFLVSALWELIGPEIAKLAPGDASRNNAQPAVDSPQPPPRNDSGASRYVRVKEDRLDDFLNRVSRLFITGEMFKDLHARMCEGGEQRGLIDEFRQIIRSFSEQANGLQTGLFALRRVAVGGLFSKFPRLARSLGNQLGKKVELELRGAEVEFDKALIEDLDAPLTHIIRNAVDHGIDPPASRLARGKGEVGQVTLEAELSRTHAKITIRDDGLGIDPEKLRRKAVEKGLFTREQVKAMSDDEVVDLIFHPGFSTAESLTDISGRGVGLDVVRTCLRKHNGDVTVSTQIGEGTTFTLVAPLREAVIVIDGLMVIQNEQEFVVPFEFIREICPLDQAPQSTVLGEIMVSIRDRVYPAKPLDRILDLERKTNGAGGARTAVLVGAANNQYCVLVDRVRGNRKVVVNSITDIVPESTNIAGVAQLGGGRMALVLSVPEITRSFAQAVQTTGRSERKLLA